MTEIANSTSSSSLFRRLSGPYRFFTVSRVLQALQLIFAVVVAALYGIDLAHSTKIHAHADAEWIHAEFVAAVSAIICLIFSVMTSIHVAWGSILDAAIFVLWLAQVGVFGSIFYPTVRPGYVGSTISVTRMRAAVWIDLVNMVLWLLTSVLRIAWCIHARKHEKSRPSNKARGDSTPFFGFLSRSRDSHLYGDQEYGCLNIDQEAPKGVDTRMSEKTWADTVDVKKSENRRDEGVDTNVSEKMRIEESS
ncbi:hypothetical protein TCE0_017f03478 [Talaromyces pinophilus]|uniref:MARVEL domain-containing protein n=1 Tax=Talaromyces pinophilus TaxID=128442 RepID=A0A6V8H2B7_TALPI|nr:hypothetical protein TCE0_017f03478 [Talaromyces pinophilus]